MTDTDGRVRRALEGDRSGLYSRVFALEDMHIRAGSDGRTVVAYAAVFGSPAEIHDQDGHYLEQISRTAFDKTVAERGSRVGVFYNHARTLHGSPSEMGSIPLGKPLEIKADSRGLLTTTRYNKTPLADQVLESIRNGDITGQSFTGTFLRSDPALDGPYGQYGPASRGGDLPLVTRQEIALIEYGPTPIPAYSDAEIVGVRNRELATQATEGEDGPAERESVTLTDPARTIEPTADARERAAVDDSAWDAGKAWAAGAASDDPAAFYDAICAGKKDGDPKTQEAHALPHHYAPGKPPNASGVRNGLSRLPQTDGLTNEAAAKAHLEAHMRAVQAEDAADGGMDEGTSGRTEAAPQTTPAADGAGAGERTEGEQEAAERTGPHEHPARNDNETERSSTMSDDRMSVAERAARLGEIRTRQTEIDNEFMGAELPADRQAEWDALSKEYDNHERAISAAESRRAQLAKRAQATESTEAGADVNAGFSTDVMDRRAPALVNRAVTYDVMEIRKAARSIESLPAAYRDNALRAVERAQFPGVMDRATAQARCEYLLNTVDDADATLARRMLVTGSPLYARAFGKAVSALSVAGLNTEESRALSIGTSSAGGYAVPFQLDPTVILTSDGVLNPLRMISRVEQITSKTWEGVTSAGITVSRANEADETTDGAPTLAQPSVSPTRVHAFVPFSMEVEQDWGALQSEVTRMLADAKDIEEATSFVTGAGTGNQPQGIVTGLGTAVQVTTAATATLATGDLYKVLDALPPRWQPRAKWLGSQTAYHAARQLFTAVASAAGDQWVRPSQGNPATLLGYDAYYASAMDTATTTSGKKIFIIGDFTQFLIVDRLGMNVELVPHLFGTASNFPTGQRGIFAIWRNSSLTLVSTAFRMLKVL